MTLWIMPEFDREGRGVCQFWLQGGKHNATPTEKTTRPSRTPLGTSGPPPKEKGGDSKVPRDSLKKNINQENLTWLGGRDHNDIPRCHHWSCSA